MNQFEPILQALDIICTSRIWQDKTPSQILRILMYVHNRGWLYVPVTDNKAQAVIGAYRIKEVNESTLGNLPVKEEGNILYVPFVVSINPDANMYEVVRSAMRQYLDQNSDIIEIVLEGKDDNLKRYKLGEKNGQEQSAGITSTADISN